jgi:hypothetical protein
MPHGKGRQEKEGTN